MPLFVDTVNSSAPKNAPRDEAATNVFKRGEQIVVHAWLRHVRQEASCPANVTRTSPLQQTVNAVALA